MKTKFIATCLMALLFIAVASTGVCMAVDIPYLAVFGGLAFATFILPLIVSYTTGLPLSKTGLLYEGLIPDVFTDAIKDNFFADDSFLSDGEDMSTFVDADAINLAEVGVEPAVVKNRPISALPATVAHRTENPIRLPLANFTTDPDIILNIEIKQLSYDKTALAVKQHKRGLIRKIAEDGMYQIAPVANTTATPILKTTGGLNAAGNKSLKPEDVESLETAWNELSYPKAGRKLALTAKMYAELRSALRTSGNLNIVIAAGSIVGGISYDFDVISYASFQIFHREDLPYYTGIGLVKLPQGATPTGTDFKAAIAYVKKESFMAALGTTTMNYQPKAPQYYGDLVSFEQRGIVLPFRQKVLGGIIQMP